MREAYGVKHGGGVEFGLGENEQHESGSGHSFKIGGEQMRSR